MGGYQFRTNHKYYQIILAPNCTWECSYGVEVGRKPFSTAPTRTMLSLGLELFRTTLNFSGCQEYSWDVVLFRVLHILPKLRFDSRIFWPIHVGGSKRLDFWILERIYVGALSSSSSWSARSPVCLDGQSAGSQAIRPMFCP